MNFNLKVFLIIMISLAIIMIIRTLKSKKISIKYGMYWTFIFIFLLILIAFPVVVESISSLCGFKESTSFLFLIAIFIIFYVIFRLYISLSKINETNKILVQEISILKKDNNLK